MELNALSVVISNKDLKKPKTLPVYFLYAGIVLFLGGVFILYKIANVVNTNDAQGDYIFNIFQDLPQIGLVFLMIIIVPTVEELVFRYWCVRNKISFVISIFSITIFMSILNLYYLIIIFPIIVLFLFLPKQNNYLLIGVFSSLMFALAHINNFQENSLIGVIMQMLGLGMVLSYVGLKYGLFFSILLHSLYNVIVAFSLGVSSQVITLKENSYNIEIKELSFFNLSRENEYVKDTSIKLIGPFPEIAEKLNNENSISDTIYSFVNNDLKRYSLECNSSQKISNKKLIKILVNNNFLKSDTSLIYMYNINTTNYLSNNDNQYLTTYFDLIKYLRRKGIYARPNSKENIVLKLNMNFLKLDKAQEMELFLLENHRITFEKVIDKKFVKIGLSSI